METKNNITIEMREALRKDFPKEAYAKHPTKTFLTTLKAIHVTERLNDVFGIGRWTITHEVIERTPDYVLIKGKFSAMDYDVIVPDQFGGHKTTGKNTEIADGYKSAVTDCISKIASYLEVGLSMFKGQVKVGYSAPTKAAPPAKTAPVKKALDEKGYLYLIEKGTIAQIQTALKERTISEGARKQLMKLVTEKVLTEGNMPAKK